MAAVTVGAVAWGIYLGWLLIDEMAVPPASAFPAAPHDVETLGAKMGCGSGGWVLAGTSPSADPWERSGARGRCPRSRARAMSTRQLARSPSHVHPRKHRVKRHANPLRTLQVVNEPNNVQPALNRPSGP